MKLKKHLERGHFEREYNLKEEVDYLSLKVKKLEAEKKEMVELLGRIYIDIDRTGDALYGDTIKKLEEWVKK